MRIDENVPEGLREAMRRQNDIEMREDHERGALSLPTGIPENCKVDQGRDHVEPSFILGDACTNGVVRMRMYDGNDKGYYDSVFCGPSHTSFLAGLKSDGISLNMGNRDFKTQSDRGKRPRRLRSDRGRQHKRQL